MSGLAELNQGAEHADVILRDGGTLRLRPPGQEAAEALLTFFGGLSQRSLYQRYHGFPELGPRLAESLVEPDWLERGVLLGALLEEDGERVVALGWSARPQARPGSGRATRLPRPATPDRARTARAPLEW